MPELQSIQQIFTNKIFRIPDYQRGFSWNEKHLEAFWQDLENLQKDKLHYMGAVTVEQVPPQHHSNWDDDKWIIEGKSFTPYYIVDGQQRITSIIVLLFTILEKLSDDDELLYQSKSQIKSKYIFQQNEKQSLRSFIFGYETDNPSYEYLKTKVFNQDSSESYDQAETIYTNNLKFAKDFFSKKISSISDKDIEELFKKITQRFRFDFQEIDKELDIFVVFETMNNRGKPLSNLELLKNRLIYLTTLLRGSTEEKQKLRKEINNTWKTIYEYLGKNVKNELSDDEFLRVHWIMYHRFDKEAEFYKKDIFETEFTVKNVIEGKISFSEIRNYIQSLQKGVVEWYKIKNPIHAKNSLKPEIAYWLEKLNQINFTVFEPLTLAVFYKNNSEDLQLSYLKAVEDYIFTVFLFSKKRRDTGEKLIYPAAKSLCSGSNTLKNITDKITDESRGHFDIDDFKKHITKELKNSYYDWSGIKYFLHEYEESLKGKDETKVDWNLDKTRSIEHIFPQNPVTDIGSYWYKQIIHQYLYVDQEPTFLRNSLGNLLLLSKSKNSELQNNDFPTKKRYTDKKGIESGYHKGSFSEIEVSIYQDWNAESILHRGLKMLAFMEKRWNMKLGSLREKKELLLLGFLK